jgi:hypothetical protein
MNVVMSLVVPAIVAGLVTIAIEYVAKPTLEVRKARLLEQHQRRWAFLEQMSVVQARLSRLDVVTPVLTRQQLVYELNEMRELVKRLEDVAAQVQRDTPHEISKLVNYSLGFLRGVVEAIVAATNVHADPDTATPVLAATERLARKVADKLELVRTYLGTAAWRRRRIRHLRRDATSALAEVEAARREVRLASDAS